jgi:heme-degrading monooxygenase HmoA
MYAVIFEVKPKPERFGEYLDLARLLKPDLENIQGFIDIERFGSKPAEGLVLSLSIWADEKAVVRWRTFGLHHEVQKKGRSEIFENYHLRVGGIAMDTNIPPGQTPRDERFDETEVGDAKVVTITEAMAEGQTSGQERLNRLPVPEPGSNGVIDKQIFESIYNPGKFLLLVSWRDNAAAAAWESRGIGSVAGMRYRRVHIVRDYGMFDRREAPQYYPAVERHGPQISTGNIHKP